MELVSVIIPAFNSLRWLPGTLDSLRDQGEVRLEVIVVDDGSSDGTADWIRAHHPEVKLVVTENRGVSHARNTGTAHATGGFIQYLDADDLLAPGKIGRQLAMFWDHPEADILYGDWQRLECDARGNFTPGEVVSRRIADVDPDPQAAFLSTMWCPTGAYLFRRSIVMRILPWKEWLPVVQDARFAWDAVEAGAVWRHDPQVAVFYRQHREGSISTRSRRAFLEDCGRNLDDIAARWSARGPVTSGRRRALLSAYEHLAVGWFCIDRAEFRRVHGKLRSLDPGFRPSALRQRVPAAIIGWEAALRLGSMKRGLLSWFRPSPGGARRQPRVLYLQYSNPAAYPPIEHGSRMLADAGCEVTLFGVASRGTDSLRSVAHPCIRDHLWPSQRPGLLQKLQYLAFLAACVGHALRLRPDWIVVSDAMASPAGWLLRRAGWRVVYHEHDEPEHGSGSFFQRQVTRTRPALARIADFCIVPNEGRAGRLKSASGTGRPVLAVMNCPRREEAEVAPARPAGGLQGFVVYYHGTIVPARLPLALVRAFRKLPDHVVLRIVGYETIGHPGYLQSLHAEAERLGIGWRVESCGPRSRADLLPECRRAHAGISLMPMRSSDPNERTMAGASNKAFDYLACGVPLLVTDLADWNAMFVDAGYARACDPEDEESIARELMWFVEHPAEAAAMGELGRRRVLDDWNYQHQFEPVADRMLAGLAIRSATHQ